MSDLPPGFVLDDATSSESQSGLPPGFVMDSNQREPIKKPRLRDGAVDGLRELADSDLFPKGLLESATDATARGLAATIDDPNKALWDATKFLILDPARSIAEVPANVANALGSGGSALEMKIRGDDEAAKHYGSFAKHSAEQAGFGTIEALTLGRGGKPVKALSGATQPKTTKAIFDDFDRSGVDPSIATTSQSTVPAQAAQNVGENLLAGGAVRSNIKKQMSQAESRKDAIADRLDPSADASVAGEAIINGVAAHASNAGRRYKGIEKVIDYNAPAPTALSTLEKIDGELTKFSNESLQSMFEPATLKKVRGVLQNGGSFTVGDIRQLRTEVRLAKSKPKVNQTQDDAAIARLERSLTDDLYSAIEATSGSRAVALLKDADRHYARTLQRVEGALKPFSKSGQTNEGAFVALRQAMQGQTASRGRGNFSQLEELSKALSPSEMDTIRAGIFRDMGRVSEGADFSTTHFATTWKKFGEKQKDIIFGGDSVRKDMDALANVIERLDRLPKAANVSRSGVNATNALTLAAGVADMGLTATALAVGNGTGRLLTNPRYVKATRLLAEAEYKAVAGNAAALVLAKKKALVIIAGIESADATLSGELQSLKAALNDNQRRNTEALRR